MRAFETGDASIYEDLKLVMIGRDTIKHDIKHRHSEVYCIQRAICVLRVQCLLLKRLKTKCINRRVHFLTFHPSYILTLQLNPQLFTLDSYPIRIYFLQACHSIQFQARIPSSTHV